MPPVIALIGASGAGKSTVAKTLAEQGYTVIPMSCVLKDMLRALGFTDADLEGDQAYRLTPQRKLGGMSPRQVASTLGTEWARNTVHPDLLVNAVEARIRAALATGCKVVIDGMRFPNEWDMTYRLGGELWCVYRPGVGPKRTWADKLAHLVGWHPRIHESEWHWRDASPDVTIFNEGPAKWLASAVVCNLRKAR
jgi:hypothetical protein